MIKNQKSKNRSLLILVALSLMVLVGLVIYGIVGIGNESDAANNVLTEQKTISLPPSGITVSLPPGADDPAEIGKYFYLSDEHILSIAQYPTLEDPYQTPSFLDNQAKYDAELTLLTSVVRGSKTYYILARQSQTTYQPENSRKVSELYISECADKLCGLVSADGNYITHADIGRQVSRNDQFWDTKNIGNPNLDIDLDDKYTAVLIDTLKTITY